MTKKQAAGVGLFLWMLAIIALVNTKPTTLELVIYLVVFFAAYGMIIWDDKK